MPQIDLIEFLGERYESELGSAASHGVALGFGRSPSDWPNASGWLTAAGSGRTANLQVWSSGEAEFEAGADSRIDIQEHLEITDASELAALLDRVLGFVDGPGL